MGLLLPILLLGLTVPTDQPASAQQHAKAPVASQTASSPAAPSASAAPRLTKPAEDMSLPDEQLRNRTCYTVRSYLFEHRNGYAPEYMGMTTCDPAVDSGQRHVRGPARLVPAN
jgi:hypothetical protein